MGRRRASGEVEEASPLSALDDALAGRSFRGNTPSVEKMLTLLCRYPPVDAEISEHDFVAFFAVRGKANRYDPELGPAVVAQLMRQAGLERVDAPVVLGLPAFNLQSTVCVWLGLASAGPLQLRVRLPPAPVGQPWVAPIPTDGPLAMPEPLPLPSRNTVRLRTFEPSLACPKCQASAREYRDLGDRLVCRACGCSFDLFARRSDPSLAAPRVRTVPAPLKCPACGAVSREFRAPGNELMLGCRSCRRDFRADLFRPA